MWPQIEGIVRHTGIGDFSGLILAVDRREVAVILARHDDGALERLDWGEITVDGKHVGYARSGPGSGALKPVRSLAKARADARIGTVFQHFNLFDHLSAVGNVVEAPVRVYGQDPAEARILAMRLLESVELGKHANRLPHRLSVGQQQSRLPGRSRSRRG